MVGRRSRLLKGTIEYSIDELSDFNGSLGDFKKIIDALVVEFGDKVNISFDAGYNNVSVLVKK